jgi:hypothetical protein
MHFPTILGHVYRAASGPAAGIDGAQMLAGSR